MLAKEFPDYPASDLPPLPEGFEDTSWHNDACPSLSNDAAGLVVYVDYVDKAKRENEATERFTLMTLGDFDVVVHTDDWNVVLESIRAHKPVPGGR